ncbi:hypothetical protein D0T84_16200 [Dysgonomonas sp. 521]|uniref:DUF6712 family protein n=1 Tax=Dysgonomonas sp. 521 TaxID=2302932 RepID=UPI0013D89A63|nr:DUF6712 family protein [Dysgonomonas sp. 521]NDV96443.1 hypothetical protein [Dysgonomonas sp. 521]
MLINNKEEFAKYIPTVGGYNPDPNNTDWDKLSPFVQEAELFLQTELLGIDLYNLIAATTDMQLKNAACTVVACMAYNGAIPYVDLIQTPNGFGVVSNTNQAPASKERVDRLNEWTKIRASEATDALITLIFQNAEYNAEWKKFGLYDYYTECLFMTAASLKRYCKRDALRYNLDELHPVFMAYQEKISRMISHEYMNDIIVKRRDASLTIEDIAMIRTLMTIMGMLYRNDDNAAYKLLETVVNTMVASLDKYPVYANSQAYRIKISDKYENKKSDPTFFF